MSGEVLLAPGVQGGGITVDLLPIPPFKSGIQSCLHWYYQNFSEGQNKIRKRAKSRIRALGYDYFFIIIFGMMRNEGHWGGGRQMRHGVEEEKGSSSSLVLTVQEWGDVSWAHIWPEPLCSSLEGVKLCTHIRAYIFCVYIHMLVVYICVHYMHYIHYI